MFRFSLLSCQRGLAPSTALRKSILVPICPLGSLPRRSFSYGTCLQISSSDSQGSGHSGNGAQTCRPHTEARCLCRQQRRVVDTGQDLGTSRSPFVDAALAAFMGIGGFEIAGDLPHVDNWRPGRMDPAADSTSVPTCVTAVHARAVRRAPKMLRKATGSPYLKLVYILVPQVSKDSDVAKAAFT
ncbi:hypothetical protein BJV78DRAFT_716181 [Lactifluus subvellereus]|nr:hypothetical protein BJV78DRAFT_716181 [Lactifluus subvellereus]